MPPVVLVARDHTLESALKSESGLILIIVAVAVGLLFIVTAVVIHGTGFFQTMRRYLRLSQRVAKEPEQENFKPNSTPDLRAVPVSSISQSISTPSFPQAPRVSNSHRISANFFTTRKHLPASHRSHGADVLPKHISAEAHGTDPASSLASPPGVVTPHIAEWMKVADSVVGRHPNSQPLYMRVATQAEIDLISGHLHIPWASKGHGRSPMIPIKNGQLTAPVVAPPPIVHPLKDVSNARRSKISVYVDSSAKPSLKPSTGKKVHRPLGKENMPPTTVPVAQVYSGRRR